MHRRNGAADALAMDMTSLFKTIESIDPAIRYQKRLLPALRRKRVGTTRFSRRALFQGMAAGRISIFTGLNVLHRRYMDEPYASLLQGLRNGISRSERVRIQAGPARRRYRVSVPTLMDRWQGRARVSVTDLHIRGTRLETIIDTAALSDFNLLCKGSEKMARQEMMTMVVSSAGNVTDSHSDDPDGSNHCFLGSKLWLVWDTFEGLDHGLDDCERRPIAGNAAFDLEVFLSLRSSRWFVVSAGQTLFLPGHLTHRVITLERYLGVGSFYVSLPNCLRTVARWTVRGPLWSINDVRGEHEGLVTEIATVAIARINRLRPASRDMQYKWGLPFFNRSREQWWRRVTRNDWGRLVREPTFVELLRQAGCPDPVR
jgi:hypothetical protein